LAAKLGPLDACKDGQLLLAIGSSISMMMAPAWAIASITSTPGMMGVPGKWPWKKGSFMVTFLMATNRLAGSNSTTLSINRNG